MNDRLLQNDIDTEEEPREYSSPACLMHEFTSAAASTASRADKEVVIYHNPACSKSRETLALIQTSGVRPRIVEYLKTPPDEAELRAIVQALGIPPAALVRKGESVFKEHYAGKQLSDAEWIAAMAANPILIERPIVACGCAAAIGRPPENAMRLLIRCAVVKATDTPGR